MPLSRTHVFLISFGIGFFTPIIFVIGKGFYEKRRLEKEINELNERIRKCQKIVDAILALLQF